MGCSCRSSLCQIAGRSCCTGIVVCLCLFAILFGVDGMNRELDNRRMHDETQGYSVLANCTVLRIEIFQQSAAFRGRCSFAWYLLQLNTFNSTINASEINDSSLSVATDSEVDEGLRHSYSNFYSKVCGGMMLSLTAVGSVIPCWLNPSDNALVRVSAVVDRDQRYLAYSVGLMILGGVPLAWFLLYSTFLCVYGCCRESQGSGARTPERQPSHVLPRHPPVRAEPFELTAADPSEKSWADRFTSNSYAQAVLAAIQRLQQRRQRRKRGESSEPVASTTPEQATAVTVVTSPTMPPQGPAGTESEVGASPMGHEGHIVNLVDDCQVCFEPLRSAMIVLPCGHYMCESCAMSFLADSFRGYECKVKCPQCRAEYPDAAVMRVQLGDGAASPVRTPSHRNTPRGPPPRLDPDVQTNEDYDDQGVHEPY